MLRRVKPATGAGGACAPPARLGEAGFDERGLLASADRFRREIADGGFEQAMEILLRAEPQERRAEADGGAVEEHEFARRAQFRPFGAQGLHHGADLLTAE